MLPNRKPDAMIIDMDETILDHTDLLRKSFKSAFAAVTRKQHGSLGAKLSELDKQHHHADTKWNLLRQWAYQHHKTLRPLLSTLPVGYYEGVIATAEPTLYPGVKDFLKEAAAQGIALHLVTSARPAWLQKNAEVHEFASHFNSMTSTRTPTYRGEKQDSYLEIIKTEEARLGRAPSVWIIGDNAGDYPDSTFMERRLQGVDISLIAVSKTSQAYSFLTHGGKQEAYVLDSYEEARAHLTHFTP